MTEVNFYDPLFLPPGRLIYSVIAARYKGKWLLVRHADRHTWEIPGGHIEEGENSHDAAVRELCEETGAQEFSVECVSTYSVSMNGVTMFGRLYFAEVTSLGSVPDMNEISEVRAMEALPAELTYPDIQPFLFKRVMEYLERI